MFSGQGISPDPKKVDAIKNAKPPTTTSGVRSFDISKQLQARVNKERCPISEEGATRAVVQQNQRATR